MKTITDEQFAEMFKPVKNHIDDNASFDGCMFETYGGELEHVMAQPNEKTWTIVSDDDGDLMIVSGFHLVNRMGYIITEKPWTEDACVPADKDYNAEDAERILGLGDQFLEDWEQDAMESVTPEDKDDVEERTLTWDKYKPLFIQAPALHNFVAMVARMNYDGEELPNGETFDMENDDTHEALSSLIATARTIMEGRIIMSERTNTQRALRAYMAVTAYARAEGGKSEPETDTQDLLTDLMHYAQMEGWDFREAMRLAYSNYCAECEEENQTPDELVIA